MVRLSKIHRIASTFHVLHVARDGNLVRSCDIELSAESVLGITWQL